MKREPRYELRLSDPDRAKLQAVADRDGRSLASWIRWACLKQAAESGRVEAIAASRWTAADQGDTPLDWAYQGDGNP